MGFSQAKRRGRKAYVEKSVPELVKGLDELKREVRRSKFYDFFSKHLQDQLAKCESQKFANLQCLALGKPAEDEGVRYQLALLLIIAEDLDLELNKVTCTEPLFTDKDVEFLELLGMNVKRGIYEVDSEDRDDKNRDSEDVACGSTDSSASDEVSVAISTSLSQNDATVDSITDALKDVALSQKDSTRDTPTPSDTTIKSDAPASSTTSATFIYAPHAPVNVNELLFSSHNFIVANYVGSYDTRYGDEEFKSKYPVLSGILDSEKKDNCEWTMVEIPDKLSRGEAWAIAYNGFGIHCKK